jgi:LytS/YehU family sensor histidine kinase
MEILKQWEKYLSLCFRKCGIHRSNLVISKAIVCFVSVVRAGHMGWLERSLAKRLFSNMCGVF